MSETTEEVTTPAGPQLGVEDLKAAVQLFDYAFNKSAFTDPQAAEFAVRVRRRFLDFLSAVTPPTTEEAPAPSQEA